MGVQKDFVHHCALTSGQTPPQNSAKEMHKATAESNHQRLLSMLYMMVDSTMAADSTATAPEVIASLRRLSDLSRLCSEGKHSLSAEGNLQDVPMLQHSCQLCIMTCKPATLHIMQL